MFIDNLAYLLTANHALITQSNNNASPTLPVSSQFVNSAPVIVELPWFPFNGSTSCCFWVTFFCVLPSGVQRIANSRQPKRLSITCLYSSG